MYGAAIVAWDTSHIIMNVAGDPLKANIAQWLINSGWNVNDGMAAMNSRRPTRSTGRTSP
jgi:hypothetical protein